MKKLLALIAIGEAATGLALLIVPSLVGPLLWPAVVLHAVCDASSRAGLVQATGGSAHVLTSEMKRILQSILFNSFIDATHALP